jgi:cyclase
MRRVLNLVLATALLTSALAGHTETGSNPLSVKITPIKGNLHLLQGKGGNVVVSSGSDGILMIDDDYAEYADAYHQALKSISKADSLPRFVLNTHWHSDHVGTNAYWAERGSIIMAHTNVYQRMSTRQEMKALDRIVEPSPGPALPMVTYDDALALRFNDDDIEVRHYPRGHTDGDSVIFFSAQNVVHMGDHYFNGIFPFVDIGSGGNVLSYTANVAEVLARVDNSTIIVPGHGPLSSKAELAGYLKMLEATTAVVKSGLASGLSVDAIVAQGLGAQWASWDQGFINEATWISFIAGSLDAPQ